MKIEEFEENFQKYLANMNIELTKKQYNQFYLYMNTLIEWNKKINLTAITDENEIILKHFIDSLTIEKYINKNSRIIDIGTGAGFPGIPLKIYREDLNITLVDSLNKRVNFLNEVIEKLNLKNIQAIHGRAEDIGKNKNYRECYDYAVSRAVANTATLSEYTIPLVKENGKCIFMKGANIDEELKNAQNAINLLGGKIETVEKFSLPNSDIGRSILIIDKKAKTNSKYPRKAGTPAKMPL